MTLLGSLQKFLFKNHMGNFQNSDPGDKPKKELIHPKPSNTKALNPHQLGFLTHLNETGTLFESWLYIKCNRTRVSGPSSSGRGV